MSDTTDISETDLSAERSREAEAATGGMEARETLDLIDYDVAVDGVSGAADDDAEVVDPGEPAVAAAGDF
jgi:hypothetical protein